MSNECMRARDPTTASSSISSVGLTTWQMNADHLTNTQSEKKEDCVLWALASVGTGCYIKKVNKQGFPFSCLKKGIITWNCGYFISVPKKAKVKATTFHDNFKSIFSNKANHSRIWTHKTLSIPGHWATKAAQQTWLKQQVVMCIVTKKRWDFKNTFQKMKLA